ncbi:PTS mannose/fructose/sorbose/N-acetylgalactosamine transporter subunit IIC [Lapidilactobacillus luobeiensis]|uniref:PTS mannose/fructose/sorbose/N-acetylgalactosamine transporter subunit IIC n=1 Tax=Lapidilactobacillus luobeiensis TaxID=2950371 RepID=UPI0021C33998|nr:PTS sugar transporter subunit IIC [Lapidilactobacillus luobeiensis]
MLLYQALVVGLVMAFGKWINAYGSFAQLMPFITYILLALLLGKDPAQALILGAAVELAFYGVMQIGAVLPQDTAVGGTLGVAFALILNQKPAVAVALAVPISMLAVVVWNLLKFWFTANVEIFDKYIDERNMSKFNRLWWIQIGVYLLAYFALAFCAILLGTNGVKAFVTSIPKPFLTGLTVAAGMLPAVGMGMLLKYVWNISFLPFFLAGFLFAAYLKLPIMAISIFGVVFGLITFFIDKQINEVKHSRSTVQKSSSGNDEEDFFND